MNKFFLLIAITLFAFSNQRVGTYVKDSFRSNDIRIDRAWRTVEREYLAMSNLKDTEVDLFRIAIYKQLVNGLNYKVFFGSLQKSTNELKLFDYVVYTGPLTQSSDPFHFELTSNKELVNDNSISLKKSQSDQIQKLISTLIEKQGDSLVEFTVPRLQVNVLGKASIYVIKVQTKTNKVPKNYLIFKDEDEKLEMIANWAGK